jgi:hypothetical protein
MNATSMHLLRLTGLLVGAGLAVAVLLAGRMPASQAEAPARLSMASQPIEPVAVSPAGPDFLEAGRLRPGGGLARGRLTLTNLTSRPLHVRMRVSSAQRDLDRVVQLRVRAATRELFEGPLSELRTWSRERVRLPAGKPRKLEFEVWVPISVKSGYEGRSAGLEVEWKKASG